MMQVVKFIYGSLLKIRAYFYFCEISGRTILRVGSSLVSFFCHYSLKVKFLWLCGDKVVSLPKIS